MVRSMLSESLQAVVSQTLLKKVGGGRVATHEIMIGTSAIRNLIREDKIAQMDSLLANARVIDASQLDTSKVSILCKVKVKNHNVGKEDEYMIVSETEANLKEKKISVKSAIGAGLLGRKVGEIVEIQVPAGVVKLEILGIGI